MTGDDACKSYVKFDEDLKLIKELGLTHYRFSISWSRLFPDGKKTSGPLLTGVNYYDYVVNELTIAGVEPMITLFHWDLPQALQAEFGGFNNSDIIQHFADYADYVFEHFGDRVKYFFTFNEPWSYCSQGHGFGVAAPGVIEPQIGTYLCGHNMLLSHAEAYKRYYDFLSLGLRLMQLC